MSGERNSFDNFEELYTNCYWLVYRYVRHMVEKDLAAAEDVTQEEKYRQKAQGRKKKLPEGRIPVRKDIMYRQNGTPFWSRFFPCRSF